MAQAYLGTTPLNKILLGSTQLGNSKLNEEFIVATGGVITFDGDFKIHTFTSSGAFNFEVTSLATVPPNNTIEYLIIAGGGGGGTGQNSAGNDYDGGGGGAGGFLSGSYTINASGIYTGSVGAGGVGNIFISPAQISENGGNSQIFGITATGGGRGSGQLSGRVPVCYGAGNGGSGGGAYNSEPGGTCAPGGTGGTGISGQGFAGGNQPFAEYNSGGAGGGGAAAAGDSGYSGNGGAGKASSISGTLTYYAGGGAGSGPGSQTGGIGGGGNPGQNGTPNTGGGGGAGTLNGGAAGSGGSGIVIVKYRYQYS